MPEDKEVKEAVVHILEVKDCFMGNTIKPVKEVKDNG
jgi:hypothetical protein